MIKLYLHRGNIKLTDLKVAMENYTPPWENYFKGQILKDLLFLVNSLEFLSGSEF